MLTDVLSVVDPLTNVLRRIPLGKLVLSPTRTYAPVIKEILKFMYMNTKYIQGMIHCSGGAQTKVMNFVDGLHIVKDNLFPIPPLFKIIQEESGTEWKEMYEVFNMGHRFEIYLPEILSSDVIAISESFGVDAKIIGHVEAYETGKKKLTIKTEKGEYEY
jgi:phosphoribosylformylglycinamidine cyclo-ligase